jgi:hypothetical protein
VASILIIASGFGFFRLMSNWGKKMIETKWENEDGQMMLNGTNGHVLQLPKKASPESVDI